MTKVTDLAAATRRRRLPTAAIVVALVAVAAIVYLVFFNIGGATVYSLTIPELHAKGAAAVGQGVRVSGLLDAASVSFDPQAVLLKFDLVGEGQTLPVVYHGVKPDNMRDDAEVIVEGKLQPDGTFLASSLLFKCPSKYESDTPTPAR